MPTGCCGKSEDDDDNNLPEPQSPESLCAKQYKSTSSPYIWYPSVNNIKQIEYVRQLECQYEQLQAAFLHLTTQFARLQFRLRQLMQAQPMERTKLIQDLERIAFAEMNAYGQCKPEELPRIERDHQQMGNIKTKQHLMICSLRGLMENLQNESDCLMAEYRGDREKANKCPSQVGQTSQSVKDLRVDTPLTKELMTSKSTDY